MAFLLDTSILIDHERGRLDIHQHVQGREDQRLFLSVVSASELLHGVHRARDLAIASRRSSFVEAILETFVILPVDLATARAHARLWADLASRGELIGPNDLWIAATALRHGATLVTGNRREFDRVPGLRVEDWRVH